MSRLYHTAGIIYHAQILQTKKCGIEIIFTNIKFANCRLFLLASYSRDTLIFVEKAPCTHVQFTMESYTFDLAGNQRVSCVWISRIEEELFCRQDRCNHHDPFAGAVAIYVATCIEVQML